MASITSFFTLRYILLPILLSIVIYNYIYACPANFKHSVVVITGTSSGIGVELAKQFGKQNARLVLAARREKELLETAKLAKEAGAEDVLVVPTDMTDINMIQNLIAKTVEYYHNDPIDVLVLNHALSEEYLFQEYNTTDEIAYSIGRTIQANLMGSIYTTHLALPYLEKSKQGGHIAVVSSASAKTPAPFHSGYVASKRGLHGFYDTIRHELHLTKSKVSIGILVLGLIATPGIIQDEGLIPLAMPVPACAHEMICAIASRWEESYIPKWYSIVTPFLQLHSGLTEWIANSEYVGKIPRYVQRIANIQQNIGK